MFRSFAKVAPPAPREIEPHQRHDIAANGGFLRLFGAIWAGVGGTLAIGAALVALAAGAPAAWLGTMIAGPLAIAGALLHLLGRAQRAHAMNILRTGAEALARVTDVRQNHHVRLNGVNPWHVKYAFEFAGRTFEGSANYWTGRRPAVEVGDAIVVLHDARSPGYSVPWTQVETAREEPDAIAAAKDDSGLASAAIATDRAAAERGAATGVRVDTASAESIDGAPTAGPDNAARAVVDEPTAAQAVAADARTR